MSEPIPLPSALLVEMRRYCIASQLPPNEMAMLGVDEPMVRGDLMAGINEKGLPVVEPVTVWAGKPASYAIDPGGRLVVIRRDAEKAKLPAFALPEPAPPTLYESLLLHSTEQADVGQQMKKQWQDIVDYNKGEFRPKLDANFQVAALICNGGLGALVDHDDYAAVVNAVERVTLKLKGMSGGAKFLLTAIEKKGWK